MPKKKETNIAANTVVDTGKESDVAAHLVPSQTCTSGGTALPRHARSQKAAQPPRSNDGRQPRSDHQP